MARTKNVSKDQPIDRVVAEETTTLPEGAVISVYRIRVGKVGHHSTRMVALHGNKRVELSVDDVGPHNLRTYLMLMRRQIERERAKLTEKPPEQFSKPKTIKDFVTHMAYHGMFIFETLTDEGLDADKPTTTKKVVQRRRKVEEQPQVCSDNNGTMQGSGKAKTNRRRAKQ